MKIEYTKVGDYYLPNLYYQEETRPIGYLGMLRNEYLKEHKSGTYTYFLLTARLDLSLIHISTGGWLFAAPGYGNFTSAYVWPCGWAGWGWPFLSYCWGF